LGYAVGAADLCAAGVGAPHIRQRLWFVADADGGHPGAEGLQRGGEHGQQPQDGGAVPTFTEWFADTKDLGGSREEYDRLYADELADAEYAERGGQT
jgi:DNA (cytosine-5)-methyltransferase 1